MSTKRLFFALWPDDRQRDRLRDYISPVAKLVEGQHVYRGSWHVTTAFIGDFEEQRITDLQARAAEINVEPFRMRFDRVEFWPRPRVPTDFLVSASSTEPGMRRDTSASALPTVISARFTSFAPGVAKSTVSRCIGTLPQDAACWHTGRYTISISPCGCLAPQSH